MLEDCKTAQERWGGVSDIIDRWLRERQELLVVFCKLSERAQEDLDEQCEQSLQHLCQILVDYVSAGHFEVYDQLVQEGQALNNKEGLKTAGESFKVIDSSTEYILDFNDKYQETDDLETIVGDLSKLGEIIEARFEAEDIMIEALHIANQDNIAS